MSDYEQDNIFESWNKYECSKYMYLKILNNPFFFLGIKSYCLIELEHICLIFLLKLVLNNIISFSNRFAWHHA